MFGVRKAPTGCNFVHNDEIWKDHVHRELQTSRRWPDTWGFLAAHYQGKAPEGLTDHALPRRRQRHPATGTTTRTEDLHLPPIQRQSEHLNLPHRQPLQLNSTGLWPRGSVRDPRHRQWPLLYPRTTAREVGWRSVDIGRLERYGRHARGLKGIRKLLNWPREAIL